MRYLLQLKNDLAAAFTGLTPENVSLYLLNGNLATGDPAGTNSTISYIAQLSLIDCREPDPFVILTYIRQWFAVRGMPPPSLHFNSDIIDLETYDWQIDLALTDKLTILPNGDYTICPDLVWSDAAGTFLPNTITNGDVHDPLLSPDWITYGK